MIKKRRVERLLNTLAGSSPPSSGGSKIPYVDLEDSLEAVSRATKADADGEMYLKNNNSFKPTQWALVANNSWKSQSLTAQKLVAGEYSIVVDGRDDRPIFIQKENKSDDLISVQGGISEVVFKEIDNFWSKGVAFKKGGFLHRRGYFFYGPQGSGKSSIVRQVINNIIKHGGIVFHCGHPSAFLVGLEAFRQVEPDRPIVCIFEDIDAIIKKHGDEELLSILDGANQINKVMNLATSNYPELLDKRITSRPRRFDRIYKIISPDDKIRKQYLIGKLKNKEDINKWIKITSGLSFAGLTEAVISVTCLGNDLEKTVEILKNLEKGQPSSEDYSNRGVAGFGGSD